jgi:hypothetical protein
MKNTTEAPTESVNNQVELKKPISDLIKSNWNENASLGLFRFSNKSCKNVSKINFEQIHFFSMEENHG